VLHSVRLSLGYGGLNATSVAISLVLMSSAVCISGGNKMLCVVKFET
jgi:hypothetical protein